MSASMTYLNSRLPLIPALSAVVLFAASLSAIAAGEIVNVELKPPLVASSFDMSPTRTTFSAFVVQSDHSSKPVAGAEAVSVEFVSRDGVVLATQKVYAKTNPLGTPMVTINIPENISTLVKVVVSIQK